MKSSSAIAADKITAGHAPAMQCPACDGKEIEALPVPHASHSALSDGRIADGALKKAACLTCGLISHLRPLTKEQVRSYYDSAYDLAVETSQYDKTRGTAYANIIAALRGGQADSNILEIGCGAGHTLEALSRLWPNARFEGLEAAPRLAETPQPTCERITIHRGFAEDLPPHGPSYDFIFSINVIEHALDPAAFLAALKRRLAPDGVILVICPRSAPPNLELLFQDHIHSFSKAGFAHFAKKAGLQIVEHRADDTSLGDFQAFSLRPAHEAADSPVCDQPVRLHDLINPYSEYLQGWASLDAALMQRTRPFNRLYLFGAGEFAALLRAYAPKIWEKAQGLIADDLLGARKLGKPLKMLREVGPDLSLALLLAVHPRSYAPLAERLKALGYNIVIFNDLIRR